MYTVYAYDVHYDCQYEKTYLTLENALNVFRTALKCEDCHYITMIDAINGDVAIEWSYKKGFGYCDAEIYSL